MKLQQLRYIIEVAKNDLNVSLTAEKLFTSQPGISKQIKQLEDELGIQIFLRSGKHLTGISPIGEKVIALAQDILNKSNDIKAVTAEYVKPNLGDLTISTTYTQARYALPKVIGQFMKVYPSISLKMEQGSSQDCIENIKNHVSDFAIVTDLNSLSDEMIALPCYHWNQSVIITKNHPLASGSQLTIQELAKYPLVSYDLSKEGADIKNAFYKANLEPNIVFSTADADLIKTYVSLGIGVGIVAKMAIDQNPNENLEMLNAGHIFPYSTTYIVFLRSLFIRGYMFDFMKAFSGYLTKERIKDALLTENNNEVTALFNGLKLAIR